MSSNSDDIQAAGSDTRPPMLDRTDYESWSQRIRLYCRGKENGLQILQSIDQGPFELGTTRDTLGNTSEGGVILGPERPRTYDDLDDNEKKRYDADVRATNIVLQGLPKDIYKLINHNIEAKAIWDNVKMLLAGSELTKEDRESQLYDEFERFKMLPGRHNQNQRNFARGNGAASFRGMQNRAGNANAGQGKPVKCYNCNRVRHIARNCTQSKRPQNSDYFKDKILLMQAQENGAVLDEEELLFLAGEQGNTFDADVDNQPVQDLALNEDNIFQADECDAFDSDVDDEPTAQTIFMANLSSAGLANPQAGPSNASILSEVHTLENAIDHSVTNQNKHKIHNEVQQSTIIDSNNADMGNSNVIPYEQYLTTNDVSVVPSCTSFALNTTYVVIDNNVHTPNEPLVTELAIYKEQVAIYEQRAKFELTEREQRMDDQMRILIQDRNRMEEKLKQELHSVKLQLNHSIKSQTVIQENVNTLQQTIKQRDSQLLNDFSNLRKLKDKVQNKLHNPFYLRKAKVAQPTLYDGNEIINSDHDPTNVPSSEEDLELAELARQKMHEKMNDPVVQKSLVTEVKAMKAVFENMEAKVDQNVVDKKCGEVEHKNPIITNENLIAECLSKDVFYTATDSVLNVSRFSDLESENFNLRNKIQNDDHDSMIKHFSKLKVEHFKSFNTMKCWQY
ncbi:retrovirus-related pol polyprotein from transposon TNT 1-94 [Tanacetum coccineum]